MDSDTQHQETLTPRRPQSASRRWLCALVILPALVLAAQESGSPESGELYGHVRTVPAQGEPIYLQGARLVLASKTDTSIHFETSSDEAGAYSFAGLLPGPYTLTATVEGYEEATQDVVIEAGSVVEVTLDLKLKPVREEIEVKGETPGIQAGETSAKGKIKQETLQNAPLVSERFQDALPLVPGVVRGADGLIKIKGAPSTQTGWLVNSANVTDPVTGEQAINLPTDVIQDVQVLSNPFDAQYGKFTGAVTTVETRPAGDKWKYNLQNFLPRLTEHDEAITPRFTLSGPLLENRLGIVQSLEYRFLRTPITSLPPGHNGTEIESFDSFTQFDITVSPDHHLSVVTSIYPQKNRYANLNTFNPQEVTANYRQSGWMSGLQDRYLFQNGSLLESTFSVKDFDTDIYPATPGPSFVLLPEGNFGSFFNTQNRVSRRYEGLETYSFAPRQAHGQHLLKLGFAFSRDAYRGFSDSDTVKIRREDFSLSERIDFIGSPLLRRDKTEFTLFLQDKWNVTRRLTFDLGARYDYDTLAQENNLAPRWGFAYVLTDDNRTLLRGGVGLFYDKVPLNVGTFEQLQQRVVTLYDPFSVPLGSPRVFRNRLAELQNPRSLGFTLELDRELAKGLLLRLGYLQREGRHQYVLNPFDDLDGVPTLLLSSSGRSRYREGQATLNYSFRENSLFSVSYVHSQALGNLNTYEDFLGNFENPIIRRDERSRLRSDAPDRFVAWGEIGLVWGVRWAPVFDVHSGFPFSLLDDTQNFVGPRDQGGRLPVFASLDSQVWKDFKIKFRGKKRRVRVGFKVFNLFRHFNPRDVQQNLDAVDALGLYNSRGRLFRGKFSIEY